MKNKVPQNQGASIGQCVGAGISGIGQGYMMGLWVKLKGVLGLKIVSDEQKLGYLYWH
jgi:hypothetical protein